MLPTAFQKMRANRDDALKPPSAAPSRADVMRANRRKAGEAAERSLVRKINRIERDMAAQWQQDTEPATTVQPTPTRRPWMNWKLGASS